MKWALTIWALLMLLGFGMFANSLQERHEKLATEAEQARRVAIESMIAECARQFPLDTESSKLRRAQCVQDAEL